MRAGDLRDRVAFDKRVEVDDGYGNTVGDWQEQFVLWAKVVARRGSETVIAARLQGVQPYAIVVRSSSQARTISAAWRARNLRTGEVYAIRSPGAETPDRSGIEFMAEAGTPT
jgi:SPP1 family predicted phage head-tail adaptor